MSCNGCRVLRKGCSDNCMLRQCLQWIDSPQAQAHATVFVAKFFGRAGLMSFISSVPDDQRPALFQSLLYEAVGRTVNPVNGAVGLLWTGNWHVCQSAVDTVFRGGALGPLAEPGPSPDNAGSEYYNSRAVPERRFTGRPQPKRRPAAEEEEEEEAETAAWPEALSLCLVAKRRAATPSEENYSETTTLRSSSSAENSLDSGTGLCGSGTIKALRLFV